jgi:HAD superfamily hydrolase (TIGR01509 family)
LVPSVPPEPQAVLFDLDGTLIDSEPVWDDATRLLASSRGGELTEEFLAGLSGLDVTRAIVRLHGVLGWVGRDVAGDVAVVQAQVRKVYLTGLRWLPGALELVDAARADGFRTALVTSTYRVLVDVVLAAAGPDRFDVVVCGDDGHAPKPDPAAYLTAAARLGLDPSACVAIEDSARGVASARAAGCRVLNVVRHGRNGPADAYAESLAGVDVRLLRDMLASART